MILTCLAKDYIVQASDRRLTYPNGTKEDHSNKALIYNNNYVFAYTGLASLSNQTAIDWAAQQLSENANLEDAVIHLGKRASELLKSNAYGNLTKARKRLSFVCAGFTDIDRKPIRIEISNFRGEYGTWLEKARDEFIVYYDELPENQNFALFVSGQPLSQDRENKLNDILKRCFRRRLGPETIGRFLTREIQKEAENNSYVGKNIMCTFVPRAFVPRSSGDGVQYHAGAMLFQPPGLSAEPQNLEPAKLVSVHDRFALPPPFDHPRFVYVSGDNNALPYLGPVYVVPGLVVPPIIMHEISITIPPVIQVQDPQAETLLLNDIRND